MLMDPWFYAVAIPAVFCFGLAKGGFLPGIAIAAVPLLALIMSPVQAAGILLPILIGMDVVAVWAYRKHFDAANIRIMLPAAAIGIGIGWLTAAYVSEAHVRLIVGIIGLVFVIDHYATRRPEATGRSVAKGGFWGTLTGFTSFVSHAGSTPFQMYMLPQKFPPRVFAGTGTILFACINALKVPPYWFLGQLNLDNLFISLVLAPIIPIAMGLSIWLVRVVPAKPFYQIAYAGLAVVSIKLIWDGTSALLG